MLSYFYSIDYVSYVLCILYFFLFLCFYIFGMLSKSFKCFNEQKFKIIILLIW